MEMLPPRGLQSGEGTLFPGWPETGVEEMSRGSQSPPRIPQSCLMRPSCPSKAVIRIFPSGHNDFSSGRSPQNGACAHLPLMWASRKNTR